MAFLKKILLWIRTKITSIHWFGWVKNIPSLVKKTPKIVIEYLVLFIIILIFWFVLKDWALAKYHNWFENRNPDIHYEQTKVDYKSDRDWSKCIIKNASDTSINACLTQDEGKPEFILCVYDSVEKDKADKCDKESN